MTQPDQFSRISDEQLGLAYYHHAAPFEVDGITYAAPRRQHERQPMLDIKDDSGGKAEWRSEAHRGGRDDAA